MNDARPGDLHQGLSGRPIPGQTSGRLFPSTSQFAGTERLTLEPPSATILTMNPTIRAFRETDRATLRELTIDAFAGVAIDHAIDIVLGPLAATDWRERKGRHVDEDIDFPSGELAVLDHDGRPVGYVSMRFDRTALVGLIPNLVVAPALRNLGFGRKLLLHALDRFRAEGMKVARIETLEHNPVGRHLYPSVGFTEVARQIHFAMSLDE